MHYLLADFEKIKKEMNNRFIFLFLDYDGTLTPIADTPQKAVIPEKTRELLNDLSTKHNCALAIISGRSLDDIKRIVGLKGIIYVGNHGLQIQGPKIKFAAQVPLRYKSVLKQIKNELNKKLSFIKGAFIEDKGLSLTLHYRLVDKKQIHHVKTIFHETVILYFVGDKIRIKPGKMVLEIRPPVEWDKGKVVLWLLTRQLFAARKERVLPVYIGDDIADEDAFKVLKNKGLTIFVGRPRESYAGYYLKDPDEVADFLRRVLEL